MHLSQTYIFVLTLLSVNNAVLPFTTTEDCGGDEFTLPCICYYPKERCRQIIAEIPRPDCGWSDQHGCISLTHPPTSDPTQLPTSNPTPEPTPKPSESPTIYPTYVPSENPTGNPTPVPTPKPTKSPTPEPTGKPTQEPTELPSDIPTEQPTEEPTAIPSATPTESPTNRPTLRPTDVPTEEPTSEPTDEPSRVPTKTLIPTSIQTTYSPTPKASWWKHPDKEHCKYNCDTFRVQMLYYEWYSIDGDYSSESKKSSSSSSKYKYKRSHSHSHKKSSSRMILGKSGSSSSSSSSSSSKGWDESIRFDIDSNDNEYYSDVVCYTYLVELQHSNIGKCSSGLRDVVLGACPGDGNKVNANDLNNLIVFDHDNQFRGYSDYWKSDITGIKVDIFVNDKPKIFTLCMKGINNNGNTSNHVRFRRGRWKTYVCDDDKNDGLPCLTDDYNYPSTITTEITEYESVDEEIVHFESDKIADAHTVNGNEISLSYASSSRSNTVSHILYGILMIVMIIIVSVTCFDSFISSLRNASNRLPE